MCTYLTQKLVNMGILCVSATGGDSVGIFENTLERMGMFFCISKSGETSMVRDKIKTAQENGVCTVAITGEQKNSIGQFADLWFRIENPWKLDDQNTMPSTDASGERLPASCSGIGSSAMQASSPRTAAGASATASTASSR